MENESMTLPSEVLKKFITSTFIETGTYDGRTVQQALDCGFTDVRSVELSQNYFKISQERFDRDERVQLYLGDTCDMLRVMMYDLTKPATIFLDAHIQEGIAGKIPAPLLQDLETIKAHDIKNHIIIIDDRRLMGTPGWWKDVTETRVIEILREINPDYVLEVFDSKAAAADILVAHL